MDIKYNYIHELLPEINSEFGMIASYDSHIPMKMYLTNVISDTFAKSKLYLDYNLTEEESQNFTEFFKQYNRLLQIPQYKEAGEAIQHLYDIYRSAVQIQEILTRIDDAKNFEKVAAEMLPDYDIDELITTLQNTDIDIAHIQKIQSAMNKIRELYHMDTTYIDVKAALYNASKDIIREYFFILEKWAQTSQEVQLIDLWYYIDNSIGLIAGSRDKDIIQERKEVVSQSIGRERIMDAIRELYTTCIDNTLERKEKLAKIQEQIREISDVVYKHPAELALPFTMLVANKIDVNNTGKTIIVSQIIDSMLYLAWKSLPERYEELAPRIKALKDIEKPKELVDAIIDTYCEIEDMLYAHDVRAKSVAMLNTALRKIDSYKQIPLLLYAEGDDKTENILYIDKLKLIKGLKDIPVLKPNIEYLLLPTEKNNVNNKVNRVKEYLNGLMENRPELQNISQSVIEKICSNIKENTDATLSYQLLNMIINDKNVDGESVGLTEEEREHLADILPISLYVTLFFDLLKTKNSRAIAKAIGNPKNKDTLPKLNKIVNQFLHYVYDQNNTNYNYNKGYGNQFINAAILTTVLKDLKEYYLQNGLCNEFTYEISTDPSQKDEGEDFLVFIEIQKEHSRIYATLSVDSKSHSNCTASSGSAPSNLAKSLGAILEADDSVSDDEIRRFFTDPGTINKALQIVQEHPGKFEILNMFDETHRLDVIESFFFSIRSLITKQDTIESQSHKRGKPYFNAFQSAFEEATWFLGYDASEDKTALVDMLSKLAKEFNAITHTILQDSQYADKLFLLITTPDYSVVSEKGNNVKDISDQYREPKPIQPPKNKQANKKEESEEIDLDIEESEEIDLFDTPDANTYSSSSFTQIHSSKQKKRSDDLER